ncbi:MULTISPECIES: hypothetical protein [unclassified Okeania]|uniref:hypothetical protein n=1 Tax=unclassified Okeania TaxID=2634635 RepID=UPI0013BF8519|nr:MULTISPECIES: hypothetical protein [unclassified Okeania]NEN88454.1 hypothetical protein [Okeania sp. SIO3H1]NET27254.1 hypothetical protein [Okeania sp. SIO1I7]NET41100.1 hypothetical protein [Okeania sp. SIO2B3]
MSKYSDSGAFSNFTNQETNDKQPLPKIDIDELLTQLKHSHELYYKMLNLEIFALVETLEEFFPGTWSQFMANRQISMKQFLQHYQSRRAQI